MSPAAIGMAPLSCSSHRLRLADWSIMLIPQVGASNELPESEELDALYDRFLVRREVSQARGYATSNPMLWCRAAPDLLRCVQVRPPLVEPISSRSVHTALCRCVVLHQMQG